eukprot:GHVS01026554.1.p1 GENE.GHVS01026554.1~~GHVS01026554.1.p1  ORF type:complete len:518 (+),score=125.00 GHVS01026554.1:244-1797(+)
MAKKRTPPADASSSSTATVATSSSSVEPDSSDICCSDGGSPNRKVRDTNEKRRLADEAMEGLEFEDPFGDEMEEESVATDEQTDDDDEDVTTRGREVEEEEEEEGVNQPWVGGVDTLPEGQHLECDMSSYVMLHRATLDWSCLSFDILPDGLGAHRNTFPHTAYVVAGTQADKEGRNCIFVMKWSKLHKTQFDGKEDSDDEDDEDEDAVTAEEEAVMDFKLFAHPGVVNRIRACPQVPRLVASWSADSNVYVWDVDDHLDKLGYNATIKPGNLPNPRLQPKQVHRGHKKEGYAIDWSVAQTGRLATGSCDGRIFLWEPVEGGWEVREFWTGKKSVEDIQWKRKETGIIGGEVMAAGGVDRTVRLFDIRQGSTPTLEIAEAHDQDINVLSWNPIQGDLLLTGGDDGFVKVWDMRFAEIPLVKLHWHKQPITSVCWHPTDEATFACSSADDSVSLWDVSVEPDGPPTGTALPSSRCPDQLMFQHMGQHQITEIKWHPQIPGVVISTAVDGFNLFKTCNI